MLPVWAFSIALALAPLTVVGFCPIARSLLFSSSTKLRFEVAVADGGFGAYAVVG